MKSKELIYDFYRDKEILLKETYNDFKYYITSNGVYPTVFIIFNKSFLPKEFMSSDAIDIMFDINLYEVINCTLKPHNNAYIIDSPYQFREYFKLKKNQVVLYWHYDLHTDFYAYPSMIRDDIYENGKKWTTEELNKEVREAIDKFIYFTKEIQNKLH